MNLLKETSHLIKDNIRDYGMYIALVAIMITFNVMTSGTFMSSRNISNLLDASGILPS